MMIHTISKTLYLPGIGKVLLEKSARARHVNITVRPVRGVRVAVPGGISFHQAEQFVKNKAGWIRARMEETRKAERRTQQLLEKTGCISRAAAKGIIVARLEELAGLHGISYNKVVIRNQKTRWGSCSWAKNLSLNYKIALLPDHLMDYVLLHELVHTRHLNHSPLFWNDLSELVGDARALDRQLHEYGALLG